MTQEARSAAYPEGGLPHGEHPHDYGYDEPLSLPVAGRFVLFVQTAEGRFCVTSWDTWEEASAAFPVGAEHVLWDGETGREWLAGTPYEWEAART